ncbi:multicopper oxidase domain-containing protein [Petroclostridium sp. X23]|uniref:multicopper oxidase family protein n=1 Tax=Petroclostridium sp. X23 TaxID=3045146 RepID=UPI0024AD4CF2|nr:multicopper oxidase domain-containing protein [Petroclostridium sp. X23]WHH59987.1 multicopper oxidase domain-containing protein [Petroclostridium sp. X23]
MAIQVPLSYPYSMTMQSNTINNWEDRIMAPDLTIAEYRVDNNIRHFHLTAAPIKHNILSNLTIEALGYNGSTPGPLIIMKQGQWIYLTVENQMDEPTALHVHGLAKPNPEDGVPEITPSTPSIAPGESYTYKFLCWQSGTFFYHSSQAFQVSQGLIGPFIVLPDSQHTNPYTVPYLDYILLLQQWEIPQPELGKVFPGTYKPNKFDRNPNYFTINGKAFPDTSPIYVRYGQKIRMRFINKSSSAHSMHLHGHDFRITAIDGFSRPGFMSDTINVAAGIRWEVEFWANNPGIWPLNGSKTFHQSNNGETPGGMTSRVIYV